MKKHRRFLSIIYSFILSFIFIPGLLSAQSASKGSDSWPNLFDYVKEHGDTTFQEEPINELDSAIFSMLSYINFEGTQAEGSKEIGRAHV